MKALNTALISSAAATIDTLSVTIRALHVNGKQMTLAVFRQLPESGHEERNEYWGIVNYEIKSEGSRWLVFSRDGRLFRRKLCDWTVRPDKFYLEYERELSELANKFERSKRPFQSCGIYVDDGAGGMKWEPLTPELFEAKSADLRRKIAESRRQYEINVEEEKERYQRDKKLAQLPQLFIAV